MKKKRLIVLIIFIIALISGVVICLCTSNKEDKKDTKSNSKKSDKVENNTEEIVESKTEPEEVTLLEFPDKSEEERQILERYSNNNDYKIIPIKEKKFKGYLIAIYEPKRMHVAVTSKMGTDGEYVNKMVADNNALLGINAGGFMDADFNGDGSTPAGLTIAKNKMVVSEKYTNPRGGIVGFDANDKLVLEVLDSKSVVSKGIRDCVSFAPYLIVNGQSQKMTGDGAFGPTGRTARSAIGQREDGIVLLLCVDGDRTKGEGATLPEIINIMQKYGAVNVSNLDGGTSCQLVVGDKMINDPTSLNGEHRSRPVASAFILSSDDSNNGDSSAVK